MSFTLRIFNLLLRLFSYKGLGKLHLSESFVEEFRKHALRSDAVIARFARKYHHPLITTDHGRWSWVGEPKSRDRHIVYFHGSGFCADLPVTFRYWADRLATLNNASVLLVDYPLSPEYPYPAALDVCLDAYRWMIDDQGLDPKGIVIGGDSAGGNLAIATLLKIKQAELSMPACAFALSPCLDLTLSSPSITENERVDCMSTIKLLKRLAPLYAPDGNYRDGLVSPLFGDCRDLPPIQLQTSAVELLRDDSVNFYEKFRNDTSVDLVLWERTPHCHQIYGFLPEAVLARQKLQAFVAEHC